MELLRTSCRAFFFRGEADHSSRDGGRFGYGATPLRGSDGRSVVRASARDRASDGLAVSAGFTAKAAHKIGRRYGDGRRALFIGIVHDVPTRSQRHHCEQGKQGLLHARTPRALEGRAQLCPKTAKSKGGVVRTASQGSVNDLAVFMIQAYHGPGGCQIAEPEKRTGQPLTRGAGPFNLTGGRPIWETYHTSQAGASRTSTPPRLAASGRRAWPRRLRQTAVAEMGRASRVTPAPRTSQPEALRGAPDCLARVRPPSPSGMGAVELRLARLWRRQQRVVRVGARECPCRVSSSSLLGTQYRLPSSCPSDGWDPKGLGISAIPRTAKALESTERITPWKRQSSTSAET